MKHKVIDNFLDEEYFNNLVTLFTDKNNAGNTVMPWYFTPTVEVIDDIATDPEVEAKFYYMTHQFYSQNIPKSPYYENIKPLLEKLKTRCLLRVKANFYPNTERLHEHPMHTDTDFPHSGAIFSLNTCDGYTKLQDGTKINSVANRVLLFDPSEKHCSTTTTNVPIRFNININYIQEQ